MGKQRKVDVPVKLTHKQLNRLVDAWGYTPQEAADYWALALEAVKDPRAAQTAGERS